MTKVDVKYVEPPRGRLIGIGDVHGCISELNQLLDKLAVTSSDTVVFLGDLIDRGPDPEGVVQRVKELCDSGIGYCVMGNHDEKVIRYHNHVLKQKINPDYKIPMRNSPSYWALSSSSVTFLSQCPHAVYVQDSHPIVFVHAGLSPSLFNQDPKAFIRNRYFVRNLNGKLTPVKSVEIDRIWHVPEGSYPWYDFWDGRWTVIYGHSVNLMPLVKNNTVGVDGGCVFGGFLRAWVKDGNNTFFVDVESKTAYSE